MYTHTHTHTHTHTRTHARTGAHENEELRCSDLMEHAQNMTCDTEEGRMTLSGIAYHCCHEPQDFCVRC